MNYLDKIAEAMDYLDANGIDPVGGMYLLANTDANGNVLDEKVASVADYELDGHQSAALVEVAQYLGGVDGEMVKVAMELEELQKEAFLGTALKLGFNALKGFGSQAGKTFANTGVGQKVVNSGAFNTMKNGFGTAKNTITNSNIYKGAIKDYKNVKNKIEGFTPDQAKNWGSNVVNKATGFAKDNYNKVMSTLGSTTSAATKNKNLMGGL